MVSRWIFAGLVLLLAAQRLVELRLSRKNEAALLAQGGREYGANHFPVMKTLHVTWLLAMPFEVFLLGRPFIPWLALLGLALTLLGQGLRYAAIRSLGPRWTVRVITLPGASLVQSGIYRYLRHPNYLGVVLEILAVPLIHTAYLTALVFSLANAMLLILRIRVEETALRNSYATAD